LVGIRRHRSCARRSRRVYHPNLAEHDKLLPQPNQDACVWSKRAWGRTTPVLLERGFHRHTARGRVGLGGRASNRCPGSNQCGLWSLRPAIQARTNPDGFHVIGNACYRKQHDLTPAEGQRILCNFVKPHVVLDGQTSAHAAGVGLASKNKWMELLEQALVKRSDM